MKNIKSYFLTAITLLTEGAVISVSGAESCISYMQFPAYAPLPEIPSSPVNTNEPAIATDWLENMDDGLGKGTTEVGFSLGASVGSHIFGGAETHDFALAKLLYGQVISDEMAKDHWYQGHWELLGEVFGGGQFEPGDAYAFGVTPGLRYNFETGTRWIPFFDAGAGVTATDIGHPDLGGTFQFNLQTGPGLHFFIDNNTAITVQYRFLHISSAGLERPNNGVNTSACYVGMSWLF